MKSLLNNLENFKQLNEAVEKLADWQDHTKKFWRNKIVKSPKL